MKKVLSIILALVMVVSTCVFTSTTTSAAPVNSEVIVINFDEINMYEDASGTGWDLSKWMIEGGGILPAELSLYSGYQFKLMGNYENRCIVTNYGVVGSLSELFGYENDLTFINLGIILDKANFYIGNRGIVYDGTNGVVANYINNCSDLNNDHSVPVGNTLTVPDGVNLVIPSGSTLTVPEGATLVVGGTLTINDGGKFICNGTLTKNGTFINNGTFEHTHTYGDDDICTICGEKKADNYGLNVNYSVEPVYSVIIPTEVTLGSEAFDVAAENVVIDEGKQLDITLSGTSGTDNAFTLSNGKTATIAYQVTDSASNVINVGQTVLTVDPDKAPEGSAKLNFQKPENSTITYSGNYSGTVTFTVSVVDK